MLSLATALTGKSSNRLARDSATSSPFWLGRRFARVFAVFFLTIGAVLLASTAAQAEEDFLDPKVAFVFSAAMASPTQLDVHFKIAPKYYMYRERFEFALTPESGLLGQAIYPKGIVKYDSTFERDLEVYHDQVTVQVPLLAGAGQPLNIAITGQGCADAGLCYPPMTTQLTLTPTATGYTVSGTGVKTSVPAPRDELAASGAAVAAFTPSANSALGSALQLNDMGIASLLGQAGWLKIIGLCLALGVLLTFTPCVLPMVPIVLAVIAGDARTRATRSRWHGLGLAATYVLGMSVVYTVLGVAAGLAGAGLMAWLQTPWVLALFAAILAVLALAMFDVFTFQAPVGLQTALNNKMAKIPGGRWSGAFFMGMLSALIVGPCVAAPLAGVLLFISQTGDLALGGSALFAMAWGQGVLLLVVGATSGALLPKAGAWMEGVKRLFGILLLATAWWMVNSILPVALSMAGWAFLALWSAVMLGAFEPLSDNSATSSVGNAGVGRYVLKTTGLMLALGAALLIIGLAAGGRDILRPLAPFSGAGFSLGGNVALDGASLPVNGSGAVAGAAVSITNASFTKVASVAELDRLVAGSTRPVMLDFYADWCVSCIEMERFTFSNPQVAAQMSQFLLVQADVTKNTEDDRALLKRFNLFGPPGIIFFDKQGKQLDDSRVIGFKNAQSFGAVLGKVLTGS